MVFLRVHQNTHRQDGREHPGGHWRHHLMLPSGRTLRARRFAPVHLAPLGSIYDIQRAVADKARCRSITRAGFDSLAAPLGRASPNALRCPFAALRAPFGQPAAGYLRLRLRFSRLTWLLRFQAQPERRRVAEARRGLFTSRSQSSAQRLGNGCPRCGASDRSS